MRLLDYGPLVAVLGVAEWIVLAALVLVFGKRALVVLMRILGWLTVALAALAFAVMLLLGLAAAAVDVATH
jgi:purine-cytosine permease-like protein